MRNAWCTPNNATPGAYVFDHASSGTEAPHVDRHIETSRRTPHRKLCRAIIVSAGKEGRGKLRDESNNRESANHHVSGHEIEG